MLFDLMLALNYIIYMISIVFVIDNLFVQEITNYLENFLNLKIYNS